MSAKRARVGHETVRPGAAPACSTVVDAGFTVVELVVVLAITMIAFTAMAATMASGMKALSIQKTRSQGNQLATQGIEDLQRYDFNDLGLCAGPADPAPSTVPATLSGLASVQLPNCDSASLVY